MLTPASVADIKQQLQDIFLANPKSTISKGVLAISLRHLDSIITTYELQNNLRLMSTEDMCALKSLMAENPERMVTPQEISEYITGIHAQTSTETNQPQPYESRHLSDSRRSSEPRRQRSNLGHKLAVFGSLHSTVRPNLLRRSKLQLHSEEIGTTTDSVLQRIDAQFEDTHNRLEETRAALAECESELEGTRHRLDGVQANFESSISELEANLSHITNRHDDMRAALDSTILQQENEHVSLCGTIDKIQSNIRSLRRGVGPLAESRVSDRIIALEESIQSIRMDLESCDEKYVSSTRYNHNVESLESRFYDFNTLWKDKSEKSWSEHVQFKKHSSQVHAKLALEIRQITTTQSHCQKSLDELNMRISSQRMTPEFSPRRRNSSDDEDRVTMDGRKSLSDELKDANIEARLAPPELAYIRNVHYDRTPAHGCSDPLPAYSDGVHLSHVTKESYAPKQSKLAFTGLGAWASGIVFYLLVNIVVMPTIWWVIGFMSRNRELAEGPSGGNWPT